MNEFFNKNYFEIQNITLGAIFDRFDKKRNGTITLKEFSEELGAKSNTQNFKDYCKMLEGKI